MKITYQRRIRTLAIGVSIAWMTGCGGPEAPRPSPPPPVPPHPDRVRQPLPRLTNFVCYYGPGQVGKLSRFQLAIIETDRQPAENVARLREAGTRVLGYVSLGEEAALQKGDGKGPAGLASWYLDADQDGKPDRNGTWGSAYVDARSTAWRKHLIGGRLRAMADKHRVDGFFFDTVETVDVYQDTVEGMLQLIREIREAFPEKILVMNRGFSVARQAAPHLDGILFEVFSMHRDWSVKDKMVYRRWSGPDLEWTAQTGGMLQGLQAAHPLQILALDYCDPKDQAAIDYCRQRAARYGFVSSVAPVFLDDIYEEANLGAGSGSPAATSQTKASIEPAGRVNWAAAENGGKVEGFVFRGPDCNGARTIDGRSVDYDGMGGFGFLNWPAQAVFELKEPRELTEVRMLLWDKDERFYRYVIEASIDGRQWTPVADRSTGENRGWQVLRFAKTPAKFVRLNGLFNSANGEFHVVEFEAYEAGGAKTN